MAGLVVWSNVERLNLVRYLAVVVAVPDPDRPQEEVNAQCRVLRTQSEAVYLVRRDGGPRGPRNHRQR